MKHLKIYKSSGGTISLNVIAMQLGVSDGTVRGWKAKDKWENLTTGEEKFVEREEKELQTPSPTLTQQADESYDFDELFLDAVKIVIEAKQASVFLFPL